MIPSGKISPDVVKQLAKGSSEAFKKVYDLYKDRTYFFFLKFCKDPGDAEELLQSLFVKLWERKNTLRSDTNFEAFLFTIAKHHAFSYLKSRSREQLYEIHELHAFVPSQNITEQDILFHELQVLASDAIESLPEKRQIIFRMKHEDGLNVTQIAEMLGLSPNTVKVQLSKAVQSIRLKLQNGGEAILTLLLLLQL